MRDPGNANHGTLITRVLMFQQPRSQGLFPGLGAGRGKDPGNEVDVNGEPDRGTDRFSC